MAVAGVILYHGRSAFFNEHSLLEKLSAHGFVGVDLFFAISGFLICRLLLQEYHRDGGINLRHFYVRRCFRILPPYYAAIAGLCAFSIFGVIHANYSDIPSCLLFYRNYKPLGMDQQGGFYTAHFWSLAVEEHFYLIWPILLVAVKPKRAGKVAFFLAIAVVGWRALESHYQWLPTIFPPANILKRTDTRIDALLWGCLAAIYFPAIERYVRRLGFSQLWIPVLGTLVVAEAVHAPSLTLLRAVLLPALVLSTVLQPESWLSRVLEYKSLRWVGTISYSLYLWQEFFLPQLTSEKAQGAFHFLQQTPWNVLAILAFACLSRYLLEIPMTRLGHRLSGNIPAPQLSPRSHSHLEPSIAGRLDDGDSRRSA